MNLTIIINYILFLLKKKAVKYGRRYGWYREDQEGKSWAGDHKMATSWESRGSVSIYI